MRQVSFCLDEITLHQLASGRIAEPECAELETHLNGCPACRAAYEKLLAPLIVAMRTPPPPESEAERQLIVGLIDRLKGLERPGQ